MEEGGPQFEYNSTSITAEDADQFAITPKEEPDEEGFDYPSVGQRLSGAIEVGVDVDNVDIEESNKKYEDARETSEEFRSKQLICCMICNGSKINWLNRRMAQKKQLAEFLCKLFGLPSLPYENIFYEAHYCSICHKKILKVGQLFKSLERVQNHILEMRNQLEEQIHETSQNIVKLTKENIMTLTAEQLKIQDIRKKIIDSKEIIVII